MCNMSLFVMVRENYNGFSNYMVIKGASENFKIIVVIN
jgi:hypothetical protein